MGTVSRLHYKTVARGTILKKRPRGLGDLVGHMPNRNNLYYDRFVLNSHVLTS